MTHFGQQSAKPRLTTWALLVVPPDGKLRWGAKSSRQLKAAEILVLGSRRKPVRGGFWARGSQPG